jgi:hypothetical protein
MITKTSNQSIIRLLLKIAECVGPACLQYVSLILEDNFLSSVELEILERIFTMDFYTDEVIEEACFSAMKKGISNCIEFCFHVAETDNTFY